MILIQQAYVNEHDNEVKCLDVLFDTAGIHDIATHIDPSKADEIIDARGLYLFPGLIDVHVHLREPGFEYKESIASGTMAAAHGGFTTIMAMPNILPFPDCVEVMKPYLEKIHQDALVNVIPYACISKGEKGEQLSDIKGLSNMGIHAFSDDGVGVKSDDMMKRAMLECHKQQAMIVAHTEDMNYRKHNACMHEGIRNKQLGYVGIPSACESAQLLRDLKLAKESKCRYHVCHMSAKESVQYLRDYKTQGVDCSGEVTAHHLLLNEMDVVDENHKMNPPLRGVDDQNALLDGLLDGTIDMIASDHAPHSEEEKNRGMVKAPFGIVSLETAFPLLYTKLVKETKRCTLQQLLYWMSEAPAKRFGLERVGKLALGYDADMILVDLNNAYRIDKEGFYSRGHNTPFDGVMCYGSVKKTYVKGKVIYDKEEHL